MSDHGNLERDRAIDRELRDAEKRLREHVYQYKKEKRRFMSQRRKRKLKNQIALFKDDVKMKQKKQADARKKKLKRDLRRL